MAQPKMSCTERRTLGSFCRTEPNIVLKKPVTGADVPNSAMDAPAIWHEQPSGVPSTSDPNDDLGLLFTNNFSLGCK